jgi:TetR/AcrR family transcriptional regulator
MIEIKEKILKAALEQFLNYGKSGAKTKTIADNAGANKALIHYYFSNKEQLFKACVDYILENMEKTFHQTELKGVVDYRAYLSQLIRAYSNFVRTHNTHITFLLWENLKDKDLIVQIKNTMGSNHLKEFIAKTDMAISQGIIRKIDPLNLYLNIISLVLSTYMILPITLSFLDEESEDNKEKLAEKRIEEVERLLWNDIKENK